MLNHIWNITFASGLTPPDDLINPKFDYSQISIWGIVILSVFLLGYFSYKGFKYFKTWINIKLKNKKSKTKSTNKCSFFIA